MPRRRYVLRYRGEGAPPEADIAQIQDHPDIDVVDASSQMLLVETDAKVAKSLSHTLNNWLVTEEQTYALPEPSRPGKRPRK